MGGVKTDVLWDRLKVDLKSVHEKDFVSLGPVFSALNSLLIPSIDYQRTLKSINFFNFELAAMLEESEESSAILLLNEFFFSQKGFRANPAEENYSESDFLLTDALQQKQGHPLLLQFLYLAFAHQLGLKMQPIQSDDRQVIRWQRGEREDFLHLGLSGKTLTNSELTKICNVECKKASNTEVKNFDPLNATQFLKSYIQEFLTFYEMRSHSEENFEREKIILWSLYLELDPNHLGYLEKRGLTYYKRGDMEHASYDLKRFFSFTDVNQVSTQLKRVYFELCEPEANNLLTHKTQTTKMTIKNLLH